MAPGGYAWWYVDAVSDDARFGLVLIAFVGSVFSPYYARARRQAPLHRADPLQHNALNLSLYTPAGKRWSMTERGGGALQRTAQCLQIGPSTLSWQQDHLTLRFDEVCAPWPTRLRGCVRLYPEHLQTRSWALDRAGRHRWWPIATHARVEVDCREPSLRWRGQAYLDSNRGEESLEHAFSGWHWARAHRRRGEAVVFYDAMAVDGAATALALRARRDGTIEPFAPPPTAALPRSAWGLARATRADGGAPCAVHRTLEDGPFYVRSLVDARCLGESTRLMHETLSLQRFRSRWVQALLPFRMPRRGD